MFECAFRGGRKFKLLPKKTVIVGKAKNLLQIPREDNCPPR